MVQIQLYKTWVKSHVKERLNPTWFRYNKELIYSFNSDFKFKSHMVQIQPEDMEMALDELTSLNPTWFRYNYTKLEKISKL